MFEFVSGVKTIEAIEAKLESKEESRAKDILVKELQKMITKKQRKPGRGRITPAPG